MGGGQSRHVFALVLCCLMLFGYAGVFFGEGLGGPHGRPVEHVTYVSLAVAKCCKVLRSCWCSRFLERWGRGGTRQHHQGSVSHPPGHGQQKHLLPLGADQEESRVHIIQHKISCTFQVVDPTRAQALAGFERKRAWMDLIGMVGFSADCKTSQFTTWSSRGCVIGCLSFQWPQVAKLARP